MFKRIIRKIIHVIAGVFFKIVASMKPKPSRLEYERLIIEDLRDDYSAFDYLNFYDFVAGKENFHVYVEVGSWKGFSTAYLAKQVKNKGKVFAVDTFRPEKEMLLR